MTLTYIRWLDAVAEEAAEPAREAKAQLAELEEIGFLLDETADVVCIGMELSGDHISPGRWRLHVPKSQIKERREMDLKAFGARRKRKT